MTLLGTFGVLGLGTLLIGELPRQKSQKAPLISTALIVVGGVGLGLGCLFALIAPFASANLQGLSANIQSILLFALGVSLTAITLVLDQALIGLLQGGLQLWRNALFAFIKLFALFLIGSWLSKTTGLAIYATWIIGNACSLVALACIALVKGLRLSRDLLPQFGFLSKLGFAAIKHHALNLTLQAPSLILPLLVTVALSATANAWFYISWNLSGIGNIVASALTLALYAVSAAQPQTLARKMRLTLGLGLGTCILINIVLLFGTQQVLGFFGHSYAEQAAWSLRILSVETFPFLIKTHYVAVRRIRGRVAPTALITVATGLLEVGGAALGVHLGGLIGLSLGWLAAMCIEVVFMLPTVYTALHVPKQMLQKTREEIFAEELAGLGSVANAEPMWLTDTLIQPVWLADTLTLSAMVLPKRLPNSALGVDADVYFQPTIRLAPISRPWNESPALRGKTARLRPATRLIPLPQDESKEAAEF
jgi:O-antigen/teichoic acid export membrane protein